MKNLREQYGCLKIEVRVLPAKEKAMISCRCGAAAGGRYMILPWLISSCIKYRMGTWGWSLCSMIPVEEETGIASPEL